MCLPATESTQSERLPKSLSCQLSYLLPESVSRSSQSLAASGALSRRKQLRSVLPGESPVLMAML